MEVVKSFYTYGYNSKKTNKILNSINKGKKIRGLYVVVLPLCDDGVLEIYIYNQLLQPYYKQLNDNIRIVGIASNKSEATNLVENLVQDMLDSECGFDVKLFFGI